MKTTQISAARTSALSFRTLVAPQPGLAAVIAAAPAARSVAMVDLPQADDEFAPTPGRGLERLSHLLTEAGHAVTGSLRGLASAPRRPVAHRV